MSPSSSTLPNSGKTLPSRHNSLKKQTGDDSSSTTANKPAPTPRAHSPIPSKPPSPAYTVFIRLPFARNGFEDPAPVQWDAAKDRQLWKLISKSNSGNLDWEALSAELGVELGFLLMQAAWLSERHMERMRKLVVKIGGEGAGSGSGSGSAVGTGDAKQLPQDVGSGTAETIRGGTAVTPPAVLSRTPSAATVTQSKLGSMSNMQQRAFRAGSGSGGRRPTSATTRTLRDEQCEDTLEHEGVEGDSDSEDGVSAFGRGQAKSRGKKAAAKRSVQLSSDGDDDEYSSGGGYLPFAAASVARTDPKRNDDVTATTTRRSPLTQRKEAVREESSTSSAERQDLSSSGMGAAPAISPRHRAQLASLSPRGSEGSPSMGSSFSDLDDASVTQSALEDALLSNMRQQGGGASSVASRIGSIRDVLGRRGA